MPGSDLMQNEVPDFALDRTINLPFERTITDFHPKSGTTSPDLVHRLNVNKNAVVGELQREKQESYQSDDEKFRVDLNSSTYSPQPRKPFQ